MIFFFISARLALILLRLTACGSALMFATVFIKYGKLGQELTQRRGDAFSSPHSSSHWSSSNSAAMSRKPNITKQQSLSEHWVRKWRKISPVHALTNGLLKRLRIYGKFPSEEPNDHAGSLFSLPMIKVRLCGLTLPLNLSLTHFKSSTWENYRLRRSCEASVGWKKWTLMGQCQSCIHLNPEGGYDEGRKFGLGNCLGFPSWR